MVPSRILVFCVCAAFIFIDKAVAYNVNKYFPLDEGNTWRYSAKRDGKVINEEAGFQEVLKVKGAEKVGGIETKIIISILFNNQCVAVASEGVKVYKIWGWYGGDYEVFKPAQMLYPNIKVGESREYPINTAVYNIRDVLDEDTRRIGVLTITLSAVEEVEVPVGKFSNCLKFISVKDFRYVNKPITEKEETISWLAPGIGLVKQLVTVTSHNHDTKIEKKTLETAELISATIAGKKLQVHPQAITEAQLRGKQLNKK